MAQAIKSVRFNALVPAINKDSRTVASIHVLEVNFSLGMGPCGLIVERLDVNKISGGLSIIQYCSNGEAKEFVYLDKDIVGRVVVLHREGKPDDKAF